MNSQKILSGREAWDTAWCTGICMYDAIIKQTFCLFSCHYETEINEGKQELPPGLK